MTIEKYLTSKDQWSIPDGPPPEFDPECPWPMGARNPKLSVTLMISMEEARALRDMLWPLYQTSANHTDLGTVRRRELFRDLWNGLRDGLPPVNAKLVQPLAFYGSSEG